MIFVVDRRAQRSSVSRSSMLNVKLGMGRPVRINSSFVTDTKMADYLLCVL
jgi:hypothetical protein